MNLSADEIYYWDGRPNNPNAEPKEPIEYAELCENIAALIEETGHATSTMMDHTGAHCLLGAGRKVQDQWVGSGYTNADWITTFALGFDHPGEVVKLNDGSRYICTDGSISLPQNPLNKDQAIELVIQRAKYWREKG